MNTHGRIVHLRRRRIRIRIRIRRRRGAGQRQPHRCMMQSPTHATGSLPPLKCLPLSAGRSLESVYEFPQRKRTRHGPPRAFVPWGLILFVQTVHNRAKRKCQVTYSLNDPHDRLVKAMSN